MAILLKKEILHERVYCGRWKGFYSRSNLNLKEALLSVFKDTFRTEEARFWDAQVSLPYRASGVSLV
jgi:hypothetical protein